MRKVFLGTLTAIISFVFMGQTCELFGGGGEGIFRSIDGGKTWQSIDDLKIKGETTDNPPGRTFSLAVDPTNPDIIYAGTLGLGIYKTENKGRTWRRINNGISLTGKRPTIYDIAVDPKDGSNVYLSGMTNDYGKIYKSTNGGEEWREVFVESKEEKPVMSLVISTKNPKVIIAGSHTGGVYASTDRGETWQHAGWFKEVNSVGISNQDTKVLYASTKNRGAYRSENFGKSWTEITRQVGPYKTPDSKVNSVPIGRMAVAPSNGDIVYLGTHAGIYRSANRGESWRLLSTTLPVKDSPLTTDIKVNPKNPNIIYFAIPNIVYKAQSSKGKWISAQLSIDAKISKIAIDPKNPNVLYAGVGR